MYVEEFACMRLTLFFIFVQMFTFRITKNVCAKDVA